MVGRISGAPVEARPVGQLIGAITTTSNSCGSIRHDMSEQPYSEAIERPVRGAASDQSRLILRAALILLAASLVNGFLVHFVSMQRQVLSAHLVGLIASALLIGLGLLWSRLTLTPRLSRAGALLAVYAFCGGWLLNFLAAVTGVVGNYPLSAGPPGDAHAADTLMSAALLSVALAQFAVCALVFRGLLPEAGHDQRA